MHIVTFHEGYMVSFSPFPNVLNHGTFIQVFLSSETSVPQKYFDKHCSKPFKVEKNE